MLVELTKGEWINTRKIVNLDVKTKEDGKVYRIIMDNTCRSPYDYYTVSEKDLADPKQFESALFNYDED